MTSYKTPSRNCPECCKKKCNSIIKHIPNGQVIPINLSKSNQQQQQQQQEPRRFSGRDWSEKLETFYTSKTLNKNSNHTWSGGPGDSMKIGMDSELGSINEIAESFITLLKNQWKISCSEVGAAVKYLRHLWLTTNGNYSQKALVVNRMICFYLILLGIYIAETCFWVDQQLLEGLSLVVLKPKRNIDMMIGLGTVLVLLFLIYLIGGPATTSSLTACRSSD